MHILRVFLGGIDVCTVPNHGYLVAAVLPVVCETIYQVSCEGFTCEPNFQVPIGSGLL